MRSPEPLPVMPLSMPAPAVLDDLRVHVAVLDHHGIVEHRHVGHAAIGVAGVEVAAEQRVLLGGRPVRQRLADQVARCAFRTRRRLPEGSNSSTSTRTDTQARQVSQAGR